MTPDERNMLNDLANKIAQTPAPPRDPEAEDFIRTKIGSRPDALYLMTQTVLIQNLALQHAQEQIRDLQQRSSTPAQVGSGSSFLGQGQGGGGYRDSNYAQSSAPNYAPPPPQYAAPSPAPPSPSGAPSFLRGAAQTAAGVAAGALAFEGIQSLFSHPGYGGGGMFGGGWGGGGYAPPVEETVVNNYYDSPQDSGRDDYRDDYRDANDANTVDDTQYDDSGNYDDGGGGFDNSGGDNFI